MKFKVGDRVRVSKNMVDSARYFVTPGMKECAGKEYVVEDVIKCSSGGFVYTLGDMWWKWEEDWLEPVKGIITIERHGNKTVAKMGKKVGVAKCADYDEFDEYTGAMIALNRLFGKEYEEMKPKFKVGDVIEGISEDRYCITKKGWIGRVTEVDEDGFIEVYGSNGDSYAHFDVEAKYFKLKIPRD